MPRLTSEVPPWVRDYVGISWLDRGRIRNKGLDCWGLHRLVKAEKFGQVLPGLADRYETAVDQTVVARETTAQLESKAWQLVPAAESRVGDAVLFNVRGEPAHIGTMVAIDRMLHIEQGKDSCLEKLDSPVGWGPRLAGFYRYTGPVRLIGWPRALQPEHVNEELPAGLTIAEMLEACHVPLSSLLVVMLDDVEIEFEAWTRIRPKPGHIVTVSALPRGGQGKSPLGTLLTILTIAAVVVAPYAVFAAGGATAATAGVGLKIAAGLAVAGVGIGGSLLANALAPPARGGLSDSTAGLIGPTITGTRNTARPFQPFPSVLGRHRFAPPYGAAPYSEIVGDDQYLRCLFALGYGGLAISDRKIAETPIRDFDAVEVETKFGISANAPMRLFPGVVLQQDLAVALTEAGSWQTRTSDTGAEELSVDITFPQGLVEFDREGERVSRTVQVQLQYRLVGTGPWKTVNNDALTSGSPDSADELDMLFRTPEVLFGGQGIFNANLSWSVAASNKPSYLPSTNYSWVVEGLMNVPQTGDWTFQFSSGDAGDLEIDDEIVLSNYGTHGITSTGTVVVNLDRGLHLFRARLEARSTTGGISVLRKIGAGLLAPIASSDMFHNEGLVTLPGFDYRWYRTHLYNSLLSLTEARPDQIRRSINWAVPAGQYEIRLKRTTADTSNERILDKVFWTAIRTIRKTNPIKLAKQARIAVRIKATDQLNGVLDEFNVVAGSIVLDWDSAASAWIRRVSSNPASLYRAVLQGRGNKRPVPDSKIDLATLQHWHELNVTRGLEYNKVIETNRTVYEVLQEIAAAGRASVGKRDGKFTVVIDEPQSVPVQHFTPRNSSGFKGRKAFPRVPHALRAVYLNRDKGWERDERVVTRDGFVFNGLDAFGAANPSWPEASEFESIDLPGITSSSQAWKHARYHLAVAMLRPEVYELSTDIEHLACTRGDLVLVTHDVPLFGLGSGRVSGQTIDGGGNLTGVKLDDAAIMGASGSYVMRFRLSDGTSLLRSVVRVEGENREVTFVTPMPPPSGGWPSGGDLWMFGPTGLETRECIVKSIDIDNDLHATLQLVDHAIGVHTADVGTIPPFDPGITRLPAYSTGPDLPQIESIRSDEFVMLRQADGSLSARMLITLRRSNSQRPPAEAIELRFRPKPPTGDPEGPWRYISPTRIVDNQVSITDVQEGITYQIRLRAVTRFGLTSAWIDAEHTVIGKSLPPPDAISFDVRRLPDGTREYSWDLGDVPPDIAGVHIRYGSVGSTWAAMGPLHESVLQSSPAELNFPSPGTWRFGLKMVDTSGNESANMIWVERTLGQPRIEGIAFSRDEGREGWTGTKTSCHVASGEGTFLEANDSVTWATLPATWSAWSRWNTNPSSPITYESSVLDAGFVFDWTPDAGYIVTGSEVAELSWSVDGVTWSAWTAVTLARTASVSARYLRGRITVTATGPQPVPTIRSFVMYMQALSQTHEVNDLDTSTVLSPRRFGVGDIRIPVPAGRFTMVRSIGLSFNGMGAGFSWEIVDRDHLLGPRVRIYNASRVLTDALIDAVIRGL